MTTKILTAKAVERMKAGPARREVPDGVVPGLYHQPKRIDAEAEKRTGWRRHGILVVAEQDPHLSWPDRQLIRQLGVKLYGSREDSR